MLAVLVFSRVLGKGEGVGGGRFGRVLTWLVFSRMTEGGER